MVEETGCLDEASSSPPGDSYAWRNGEPLLRPVACEPLTRLVGLVETGRLMRENPMSILPGALFRQTRLSGPHFGRSIHEVSGPAEMKSILLDNYEAWRKSPLIMRMLRPILGEAILTAHGENWHRQRKSLQPAFLRRRIEGFAPIMAEVAETTALRLSAEDQPVEIQAVLNDATFSVIERVLFSDAQEFDRVRVRSAIEVILAETGTLRMSDLLPAPEWVPRLMSARALRARHVFRKAAMAQIRRRRESGNSGDDLLGLLLELRDPETGEGLSDRDIRDTVMTFIAAGHETTAIALTWALYLVASDAPTQKRLRAEAAEAMAHGRALSAADLPRLTFSRQVIEEAMRLYPPAPILGRRAIAETEICGHPVKKGDVALLAFYALHRHETLWDQPDHFDPDRFSPERRPKDRYQFMAFGGGPRACIGANFALMEATIFLSTLVAKLGFTPVEGHDVYPVMQVTLRPRGGMALNIQTVRN